MSYQDQQLSVCAALPFELYQFQTAADAWYLASGDRGRTYAGHDYLPTAVTRTAIKKTAETANTSITVTIPRDHAIAGLFRAYMPISPLGVLVFSGHDEDPEVVCSFTGRVSVCNMTNVCELTCTPDEAILKRSIPASMYQTPCNRVIFSASCGVLKENFKVDGTVSAISADGVTLTSDAFGTVESGWLTNGFLEVGLARRMVMQHIGTTVTLLTPFGGVFVGDAVTGYAGCPRTFDACGSKFDNAPRFLGFEMIPQRNPFNGVEY